MSNYSTAEDVLQAVTLQDSAGKSVQFYVRPSTGEIVEPLRDDKFDWRQKKKDTLRLADVYGAAQDGKRADKAAWCSTWLEYLATGDLSKRQLYHMNACHQRLCPLCGARRAHQMAARLRKVLEAVEAIHPGVEFIFLTLTVQNVPGDKLRDTLTLLTGAWSKLTRRRSVDRAIKGWFRAIEITRNRSQDTYHPHIHAVLAVEPNYFTRSNGLYITQQRWREMWQESLKANYLPIVHIEKTKSKGGKSAEAAAVEAAKYCTKSSDYIGKALPLAEAAKVAEVYTAALSRKRMTALGGWLLEAEQSLGVDVEAEGDLIHDEDGAGTLNASSAELLESYGWHSGVSEHVLRDRRPNPDFLGNLPSGATGSAEAGEAGTVEIDKSAAMAEAAASAAPEAEPPE